MAKYRFCKGNRVHLNLASGSVIHLECIDGAFEIELEEKGNNSFVFVADGAESCEDE